MTVELNPRRPHDCIQFMVDSADAYAQACSAVADIENGMKRTRALLMKKSEAKTVSERENDAWAHQDMVNLIAGYKEAVYFQTLLKTQLKAAELAVDVFRTLEASARREGRATQ